MAAALVAGGFWWWNRSLARPVGVKVSAVAGGVQLNGAAAAVGEHPAEALEVRTENDGFASLELGDGSRVQVMPGTRLKITEAAASRAGDRYRVRMQLDAGEIQRELPPPAPGTTRESQVLMRAVNVGVRGTVFLARAEGESGRVMVHRGEVRLEGRGEPKALTENYGTVVREGQPPENPTVLPPPPTLHEPAQGTRILEAVARLRWEPHPQASAYVWEVARDPGFKSMVARGRSQASEATVERLLEDGLHHWRVASVDARALQGRPGEPRGLHYKHHHQAGAAKLKAGDPAGALALFARAVAGYPDDAQLLKDIGWAHYLSGSLAPAKQHLDRSVALDASDLEARVMRGRVHYWLKEYPAAEADYRHVLGVLPKDLDSQWGLAEVQLATGKPREALKSLEPVLAAQPRHEYAWMTAARAWHALGDRARTRDAAARELALRPDNAAARDLHGPDAPAPKGR